MVQHWPTVQKMTFERLQIGNDLKRDSRSSELLLDYSIGHILVPISDLWWPVWLNGRAFAHDPKGRGFESAGPLPANSLGQAAYMHVSLSPSSIN